MILVDNRFNKTQHYLSYFVDLLAPLICQQIIQASNMLQTSALIYIYICIYRSYYIGCK